MVGIYSAAHLVALCEASIVKQACHRRRASREQCGDTWRGGESWQCVGSGRLMHGLQKIEWEEVKASRKWVFRRGL